MWARVKGKTENDLMRMGFKQAYMFRPGAIIPLRGIKSSTKLYQFILRLFLVASQTIQMDLSKFSCQHDSVRSSYD